MATGRTPRTLHGTLDAALRPVENVCAVLAGLATLTAMLTVSADALMRHVFAAPLTFQHYLTENYLMVALLLLALPWGYRTGGFIRIGFVTDKLPRPLASLTGRLCLLFAATYIAYLGWLGWGSFVQAYRTGEVEMGVIDWPVAWSKVFVPFGLFILSLRLLIDMIAPAVFTKDASHVD